MRVQIEKQFSPKVEAGADQSPLRVKRWAEQDMHNGADPSLVSATKGLNDDTVASVLDAALGDLSHNSSKCTQARTILVYSINIFRLIGCPMLSLFISRNSKLSIAGVLLPLNLLGEGGGGSKFIFDQL